MTDDSFGGGNHIIVGADGHDDGGLADTGLGILMKLVYM